MIRLLLPVLIAAAVAGSATAQSTYSSRYGSASGFGSVLFPGTGHPPEIAFPGSITSAFPLRLGATVRGYPPYLGVAPGYAHPAHGRQYVIAVPVTSGYVGAGYYPYYDPGSYLQQPVAPVGMQQAPPQQVTPPVVIINQQYRPETASPVVRTYGGDEEQAPTTVRRYDAPVNPMPDPNDAGTVQRARIEDEKPTIYLIAFKDHTILPALAYWVEGETLNYVSSQGTPNRASLSLIDKEFSKQLNKERQVEFSLP
jgi:hypothetical protein